MEIKMELIFRKIDTTNHADIADFNELMDDLANKYNFKIYSNVIDKIK